MVCCAGEWLSQVKPMSWLLAAHPARMLCILCIADPMSHVVWLSVTLQTLEGQSSSPVAKETAPRGIYRQKMPSLSMVCTWHTCMQRAIAFHTAHRRQNSCLSITVVLT